MDGQHGIAVSRLCCPVCWTFLDILDNQKHYGVRGFHFKVFALQLPSWVPDEMVQQMLTRIQAMIRDEVKVMLLESPPPRTSVSSLQSVGSLRASSVRTNSSVTSGGHARQYRKIFNAVAPAFLLPFKREEKAWWTGNA